MKSLVLPDQTSDPLWVMAVATLLVATAALLGAVTPMIGRRIRTWFITPANDNEAGLETPRSRLRGV